MKKLILLIPVLAIAIQVSAQRNTKALGGFIKIGYAHLPNSANTIYTIAPHSGDRYNNSFIDLGSEAFFRSNHLVVALDGDLDLPDLQSSYHKSIQATSGSIYAKVGWIIMEKPHYYIYPSFGLGIAAFEVSTYNGAGDEAENLKYKDVSSPSFDFGLNADYIFRKVKKLQDLSSFMSGLHIGYRLCVKNASWRDVDGNRISGMPSYSPNGFYVTVTIGSAAILKGR